MISKKTNSNIAIIITAAGSSTRMGGITKKEYLPFNNGTVLSGCAKTFLNACLKSYRITDFIITYPAGGIEDCKKALEEDKVLNELLNRCSNDFCLLPQYVEGSDTRQKSVYNGLKAIKNNPDIVLIHDGARPFISEKVILDAINAAYENGASVPGITPVDTQKEIDENGFIIRHLQRSHLTAVQTPQCFDFKRLLSAHEKAIADNKEYTDDTEIWGVYCGAVKVVEGDVNNIKITYPADLQKLENK